MNASSVTSGDQKSFSPQVLRVKMRRPVTAITRQVSASINNCELSFHARQPIDVAKAMAQHKRMKTVSLGWVFGSCLYAAEPELPDAVFVEDPAAVVDGIAVISIMGKRRSRRPEASSVAQALSRYRAGSSFGSNRPLSMAEMCCAPVVSHSQVYRSG